MDTSALLAALIAEHEHHRLARPHLRPDAPIPAIDAAFREGRSLLQPLDAQGIHVARADRPDSSESGLQRSEGDPTTEADRQA